MKRRPFGMGALLGGRQGEPVARRRVVLRARITVDLPAGMTSSGDLEDRLAAAIVTVIIPGGGVESVQVGLAIDPAWQTQGPPAQASGDAAPVARAG